MTRGRTIHFGFEVGSGKPVEIPIRHTAITGQTQEAGKTTALEGLISRHEGRSLAFVTKRAEGSFAEATPTSPYFRERADWQFVAAILEATLREKLKFERAWIMRASKGAKSLGDVQRNVREAMKTAKGMSADVYLTLDSYLDIVVPQIERVQWSRTLSLKPGLNVMYLDKFNVEMQALVIRSCLEWVYENEDDTVVVIPEAWEFVPQTRGSPVKLELERLIRKGASAGNYVWLDSQDIGGVNKEILRSVPVWCIGVQREINEVKRGLSNMPAGVSKPTPTDIISLELGQFYVCWGKHVIKAYAQPAWLSDEDARAVATGERGTSTLAAPKPAPQPIPTGDPDVKESEASELREANRRLNDMNADQASEIADLKTEIADLRRRLASNDVPQPVSMVDEESLYQSFKARLAREAPQLLRVLVEKPEITVEVRRQTVTADGSKGHGLIARMIAEGFFDAPTKTAVVNEELKVRGLGTAPANIARWCDELSAKGFLRKTSDGYVAVEGMKINIVEA